MVVALNIFIYKKCTSCRVLWWQ